jgi:predicted RNA methylase
MSTISSGSLQSLGPSIDTKGRNLSNPPFGSSWRDTNRRYDTEFSSGYLMLSMTVSAFQLSLNH